MIEEQLVRAVADVIAKRAGWFQQVRKGLPQPLARQLNNPGLLTSWRKYDRRGNSEEYPVWPPLEDGEKADRDITRYVDFPTEEEGWKALLKHTRIRINPNENAQRRGSRPASAQDLFRGRDDKEYLEMIVRTLRVNPQEPMINLLTGGTKWPTMTKQSIGSINLTNSTLVGG